MARTPALAEEADSLVERILLETLLKHGGGKNADGFTNYRGAKFQMEFRPE